MRSFALLAFLAMSLTTPAAASDRTSPLMARLASAPAATCTGAAGTCGASRIRIAQSCPAGYKFCQTPLGKTCCAPVNSACYCP